LVLVGLIGMRAAVAVFRPVILPTGLRLNQVLSGAILEGGGAQSAGDVESIS
jgi:hypothetical protein